MAWVGGRGGAYYQEIEGLSKSGPCISIVQIHLAAHSLTTPLLLRSSQCHVLTSLSLCPCSTLPGMPIIPCVLKEQLLLLLQISIVLHSLKPPLHFHPQADCCSLLLPLYVFLFIRLSRLLLQWVYMPDSQMGATSGRQRWHLLIFLSQYGRYSTNTCWVNGTYIKPSTTLRQAVTSES